MSRSKPSLNTFDLAQQLLACEVAGGNPALANVPALFLVSEKLRRPLVTLAGTAGFRSLLARALTLAKARAPELSTVQIEPDGSLLGDISDPGNQNRVAEAGATLIAQLLGLLVTFVGESLMLSLVLDAWPDLPVVGYGAVHAGQLEEKRP